MNLRDVGTQGDPLGNAATPFLDSFVPLLCSDIEEVVRATLVESVNADLSPKRIDLQACSAGGSYEDGRSL